jgi:hypothetical protein
MQQQETKAQTRERIMAKVQKILSQAKGTTFEAEAATAMRMASELMEEHNISEADLIIEEIKGTDGLVEGTMGMAFDTKMPQWMLSMSYAAAKLYDCEVKCVWDADGKIRVKLFGYKFDVEMANWTFGFVSQQMGKAAIDYASNEGIDEWSKKKQYKVAQRKVIADFLSGAASGISQRVAQILAERKRAREASGGDSRALMVVNTKAVEIRKKWGQFNYGVGRGGPASNAYSAGRRAAAGMNLGQGVVGNGGASGNGQKRIG